MMNCPFCDAELQSVNLHGGRCPACGSIVRWEDEQVAAVESSSGGTFSDPTSSAQPPTVGTESNAPPATNAPPEVMQTTDSNPAIQEILRTMVLRGEREQPPEPATPPTPPAAPPPVKPSTPTHVDGPIGPMATIEFAPPPPGSAPVVPPAAPPRVAPSSATHVDGPIGAMATMEFTPPPPGSQPPGGDSAGDLINMWGKSLTVKSEPSHTLKSLSESDESMASNLFIRQYKVQFPGEPTNESAEYQLLDTIGKGGVGVVYAARQSSIDRTVALKMLRQDFSQIVDHRNKFLSEAVVTGELDHPNIVPIYDLGTDDAGSLFYSMKRVRGTPWSEVIASKSLHENLDILMSVADAIAFAHARGVIHRDLKPENVMLGDFGEVLVMDWGIALSTPTFVKSGNIAQTTSMGGTPAYMSPEMATGPLKLIGPPSDVYLLGSILYEIICGKPPHTGKDVMGCLYAAARNEIQPTEKTGELIDIAFRAMATQIEERYPTVQDFQSAIRQYRSHSESIVLSNRAEEELAAARKSLDYQDFARSMFAFQEAHTLWPENYRAKTGEVDAKIAYASCALDKGDYDLGISLLNPGDPKQSGLRLKLLAAQSERDARQQRLKTLRRTAIGLVALIFLVVTTAFFMIWSTNTQLATSNTKLADNEKKLIAQADALRRGRDTLKRTNSSLLTTTNNLKASKTSLLNNQKRLREEKERADSEAHEARVAQQREALASYLAQIGVSSERIANNSFLDADRLLKQYLQPGSAFFRHWEWGHLRHLCKLDSGKELAQGRVESLAQTRDGQLLVAGNSAGTAEIWKFDWDTLARQRVASVPYNGPIYAVAISPDGKQLAIGGDVASDNAERGVILLFQLDADGKPIGQPRRLAAHFDAVLSLDFSADGTQLVSGSRDSTARLWDCAGGTPLRAFRRHFGPVWCVKFAPNRPQILTAGDDGTVRLWNTQTEEAEPRTFRGHKQAVYAAAYSPDGRQIASAGRDNEILVWNPALVQEFDYTRVARILSAQQAGKTADALDQPEPAIEKRLEGHTAEVRSLHFSSGGQQLLSGGNDNTSRLWSLRLEPSELKYSVVLRGHGGWVRSCLFSPQENYVVSGSHDQYLKLWCLRGNDEVRAYEEVIGLRGHDDAVLWASFSADEQRVITASRDRRAIIWNVVTGQPVKTLDERDEPTIARAPRGQQFVADLKEGHEFLVTSAAFFPPGDARVLTSAGDDSVRVWDTSTGGQLRKFSGTGTVGALSLSRDGKWLLTGSDHTDALLWRVDDPNAPPEVLSGHTGEITAVAFSQDKNLNEMRLFTGDTLGVGRVWRRNAASGKWEIEHKLSGHQPGYGITAARFLPDRNRLLTASYDRTVLHWDLQTGRHIPALMLRHPDGVKSMDISNDGRTAVTLCSTSKDTYRLFAWDVERATERHIDPDVGGETITMVALHHDQRSVLVTGTTGDSSSLWRWDFASPKIQPLWAGKEINGTVWSAICSTDGSHILAVGGSQARLLNATSGDQERTFNAHGSVTCARFSPSGKLAATSGSDGDVKIWVTDETSPQFGTVRMKLPHVHEADGVTHAVNSVMFHPLAELGEHLLLTAGDDGTAKLWDISAAPKLLVTFSGHRGRVHSAVFSPRGEHVLTASVDGTARLWNAKTGEPSGENDGVLDHPLDVLFANFSPDGKHIITGCDDNIARIWGATDVQRMGAAKELKGHTAAVTSVAISPDGLRAITGSQDGMAKIWDLEGVAEEVLSLKRHTAEVTSVQFSSSGRYVLTSSHDRSAIVWPSEPISPTIKLTDEPLQYLQAGSPQAVDSEAMLRDPDAATLSGGKLVVELIADTEISDELITFIPGSGLSLTAEGTVTLDIGDGSKLRTVAKIISPPDSMLRLEFDLAAESTAPAIEAIIRQIHYTSPTPVVSERQVRFIISDGSGGESHPALRRIVPASVAMQDGETVAAK